MSLVGDALRKARQEAAERDADRRGVLFSARISESHGRSHLGLGLALGAVIAVAATVAGGVAVLWYLDHGDGPATVETTTLDQNAGEPAPDSLTVDDSVVQPSSGSAASLVDPSLVATVSPPESTPAPDVSTQRAEIDLPPTAGRRTGTADTAGFELDDDGARVYLLEARLGNTTLSLDYIVFRTDDPFAEINGVEVHLGGEVGGFRVKAIERDRVRLSDGRRTIVLRTP